jgi:hypothetical protein
MSTVTAPRADVQINRRAGQTRIRVDPAGLIWIRPASS